MRYTRLRARRAMGDLAPGQRLCGSGVVDDCYYLTPTGAQRYVPPSGQRTPVPVTVTVTDASGNVKTSTVTPTIAYANQGGPGPGGAPAGSIVDDHTGAGPPKAIVASNGVLVPISKGQQDQIIAAINAGTMTGAAAADQLLAQQTPQSSFDLSRFMPVLLLGGAAVAAVMLLRRKPKPPAVTGG